MRDWKEAKHFITALWRGQRQHSNDSASTPSESIFGAGGPEGVKLFVPPGHYYSPIVPPDEASRHVATLANAGTPSLLSGIELDAANMARTWQRLLPFLASIPFHDMKSPALRYAFDNPNYAWGDGSILHAMLRYLRPRRYIEIGSGWSSACALDTIDRFFAHKCEVTFVEPHPELLLSPIGDVPEYARIIQQPVQSVPLATFDELQANDILFIDSTHVARTGSDVCFELFEILPRLAPGGVVHIHDIFWPFEYPRSWIVEQNRSWNEAYAVRAFLSHNNVWRIVMFNDYLAKLQAPMIEASYPTFLKNPGAALWLRHMSKLDA